MEWFEKNESGLEIICSARKSLANLRVKKNQLQVWFSANKCKNLRKHSRGLPPGFKVLVCGLHNYVLESVSGLVMVLYKDSSGNFVEFNIFWIDGYEI